MTATLERRRALAETIRAVARRAVHPADRRRRDPYRRRWAAAIDAGADKVSLNTAALSNPALITTLASRYGSQAIIVAIDAKRALSPSGVEHFASVRQKRTVSRRSRRRRVGAGGRGAGRRRNPADVDRSGRHEGRLRLRDDRRRVRPPYRFRSSRRAAPAALDDFVDVFTRGAADAALAASIFHYAETSVRG